MTETIEIVKIMWKLSEMRSNKVLIELDKRYQKGHLDAIDILLKWLVEQ